MSLYAGRDTDVPPTQTSRHLHSQRQLTETDTVTSVKEHGSGDTAMAQWRQVPTY